MPNEAARPIDEIKTTLIVGAGGVGKEVMMRLRRMIVENYRQLDNVPVVQFLHLDTDTNLAWRGSSSVLGENIELRGEERIELSQGIVAAVADDTEKVRNNPKIQRWLYDELPITRNFTEGAGGIRACGRLAFHYSADIFRQQLLAAALRSSSSHAREKVRKTLGFRANEQLNVNIVCSLLGGTASGSFLDICYNAMDTLDASGYRPIIHMYLVIGGDSMDEVHKANCYAALMELEYFASSGADRSLSPFEAEYPVTSGTRVNLRGAPFKYCYLVNWSNQAGRKFSRDQLEELLARDLFFEFAPGLCGKKDEKRVDMMGNGPDRNLDKKLNRYQGFFTLGLSVLEFPAIRIRDMFTDDLAAYSASRWLFEDAKPMTNLSGAISEILKQQTLQEKDLVDHLLMIGGADKRTTLNKELNSHRVGVDRLIDAAEFDALAILNLADSQIKRDMGDLTFDFDPAKCGGTVAQIRSNKRAKARTVAEALEKRVAAMVGNQYEGPANALDLVNGLQKSLTTIANNLKDGRTKYEERCRTKQGQINREFGALEEDLHPKFRAESHAHNEALHGALRNYLQDALLREAYRFGHQLLEEDVEADGLTESSILARLARLKVRIETHQKRLKELAAELDLTKKDKEFLLLNEPIASGLSLDRERLGEVKKDIVKNFDQKAFQILSALENSLGVKDDAGNPISPMPIFTAVTEHFPQMRRGLLDAARKECEGARHYSIAKELSRAKDFAAIVQFNMAQASCLLNLSNLEDQTDHLPRNHYRWIATANKEDDPAIEDVLRHVRAANNNPPVYIEAGVLPDAYQIVFAAEKNAFPLRCIEFLPDYRKSYQNLTSRFKTPRHTNKQIEFRDLLPEDKEASEIRKRSQDAHVLGKVFGLLVHEEDPATQYPAIFLSHRDSRTNALSHTMLASGWDGVEEVLSTKQIEKQIDHLSGMEATPLETLELRIASAGRSAKTRTEREALWDKTQEYLLGLRSVFSEGEKHPEFQRQQAIIQEFRKLHMLEPPASAASGMTSGHSDRAVPAPSSEGRFRDRVRDVMKRSTIDEELRCKLLAYASRIQLAEPIALRILTEETVAPNGSPASLAEYEAFFRSFADLGTISAGDRADLLRKQSVLALTDAQVNAIEFRWASGKYLAMYQDLALGGDLTPADRADLKREQAVLRLTDQQVAAIESKT